MSFRTLFLLLLAMSATTACRENHLVPPPNAIPMAVARAIGTNGKPTDSKPIPGVDAGADASTMAQQDALDEANAAKQAKLTFALPEGVTEVEVTLDGTASYDDDGKDEIAQYIWLSGTALPPDDDAGVAVGNLSGRVPAPLRRELVDDDKDPKTPDVSVLDKHRVPIVHDAGTIFVNAGGRLVPEGEAPNWPKDVARPKVTLTKGYWIFTLWVRDRMGSTSLPDTIEVIVGDAPDPNIPKCAAAIDPVLTNPDCRTCVCQKKECQSVVVECDSACWGMLNCISVKCPDIATLPMEDATKCVTDTCAQFLQGYTSLAAVAPCVVPDCIAACPPMPF